MKTKYSFNCNLYGWTPEKVHVNKETASHIAHHLNNELCKTFAFVALAKEGERVKDNLKQVEQSLKNITEYVEMITKRVRE